MLLSLLCNSCQDDFPDSDTERVEEGLPATITLKVKVNDMDVRSRTIAEEERSNYCDNIWVGLYSKDTKERLGSYYTTDVEATHEATGVIYNLHISTKSANNVYIVAVANSDINSSIDKIDNYGGNESILRNMLDKADTFDKLMDICILRPDAKDVNVYANTLTMTGWYADQAPTSTAVSNMKAVNISKGENKLTGAIYLQRILSFNKFIVVPGQYVNVSLNSWQVYNVPAGCPIFDQDGNVGDKYSGKAQFYNESVTSHYFKAAKNAKGESGHSFEFYQLENKHTALDYQADGSDHVGIDPNASSWYDEREREFKDDDNGKDVNTGVYRSLVYHDQTNISNNNASYVVLNATVDYYIAAPDDLENFDPTKDDNPIDPTSDVKKIHRTANVNYTIHLGYCEGKEDDTPTLDTAKDFNCRRNTKYTYNVKINGVHNLVVEANSDNGTENQPGVEGWASDEIGEYERLDAHYCEFNISLTDDEREHLSYRITAPYGGKYYYYSRNKSGVVEKTTGINDDLHTWIKFYPTSDENTLAEYNGGKGRNSKGDGTALWTFDNMCTPTVKTSPYDADANGKKWYTVFVDEYVYTFDDQGSKETSWPNYVNEGDRIAEFIIDISQSKDSESSYSYCKYMFSQKSIQTYYTGAEAGETAIGIEHTEETYCLNMNWNFLTNNSLTERDNGNYDYANGRFNLYYYLTNKTNLKWESVIQEKVPCHVMAGSNVGCSHQSADYKVYMPMYGASIPSNQPTPDDTNAYYANSICMNRNRDLDGNGTIDVNEMRWFTPTGSQYIQIAIAQSELPDPIMRFTDYNTDYFDWTQSSDGVTLTYNFHYITSDYLYYWAEQAVNVGKTPFGGYWPPVTTTNTVRCIRNLGTDPGAIPTKDVREVEYAYTHDAQNRTFTQNKYSTETLRGYNIGGIAPHDVSSPSALPYKKFEYAKHICVDLKDSYINFNGGALGYVTSVSNDSQRLGAWTNSLYDNGICGQYSQADDKSDLGSWRIPTAYELAFMWIEGLLRKTPEMEAGYVTIGANSSYYLSSTYDYFESYSMRDYTTNNHMYLGYNDTENRQVLALDCLNNNVRLRCVRDVKVN
jgi:hypothetical protein